MLVCAIYIARIKKTFKRVPIGEFLHPQTRYNQDISYPVVPFIPDFFFAYPYNEQVRPRKVGFIKN